MNRFGQSTSVKTVEPPDSDSEVQEDPCDGEYCVLDDLTSDTMAFVEGYCEGIIDIALAKVESLSPEEIEAVAYQLAIMSHLLTVIADRLCAKHSVSIQREIETSRTRMLYETLLSELLDTIESAMFSDAESEGDESEEDSQD